jgi:hypothetical protein
MQHSRHVHSPIVCLCGSTKFYEQFMNANYRETLAGKIVLSVGFFLHSPNAPGQVHGGDVAITADQKAMLDELHLRKIDLADEVLILNVGDYIGTSTKREAWYAATHSEGKVIRFLEPSRYSVEDLKYLFASRAEWARAAGAAAVHSAR